MKSEEPFDKIEGKIKEAANGTEFVYTDAAWQRMELLLDKQQKKRKIFFWLWPLVIGALLFGIYLLFIPEKNIKTITAFAPETKEKQANKNINLATQPAIQSTVQNNTDNIQEQLGIVKKITSFTNKSGNPFAKTILPTAKKSYHIPFINTARDIASIKIDQLAKNRKKYKTNAKIKAFISKGEITTDANEDNSIKLVSKADTTFIPSSIESTTKTIDLKNIIEKHETNLTTAKDTAIKIIAKNKVDKQKKVSSKKVAASLYVITLTGAEANTTKPLSFANTIITSVSGIDLGYQINKKWSIQTGFRSSAKKYIAGPRDYNVKTGTYLSMVNIIKVDANCRVYAIPLIIKYNWMQKKLLSFYSSAGISSYIMKREDYNFTFERNNYVLVYPYSYTGNKNLFATIQLSTGIEQKLNSHFYLQAAPIIEIPLVGIGQGSVKLYTKSVQIGLKYFPFRH